MSIFGPSTFPVTINGVTGTGGNVNGALGFVGPNAEYEALQAAGNAPNSSGVSTSSTNINSTFPSAQNLLSSVSGGSLIASTSKASRDMRVVIAPAGGATASAISNAAAAAATPANTSIFSASQLSQYQGNATATNTSSASNNSGVPSGTGYYSGILAPLIVTNGVLFPYSPNISFSQDVDYSLVGGGLVHTNQDYNAYQRTPSVKLTIEGNFTIQNQYEGLYMLAVIHFFRTVSKMYFGQAAANSGTAGLPPPILILNGYGTYMFNNLPCILTGHSWNYSPEVDTIDIADSSGGITKLPSLLDLSISLTVQQTPYNMSTAFDLNQFRSGALMKTGGGWI
jgi:hypothetical protein